ncbi:hypothetical protein NG791_25705 [Laspinema sp. D1]|uniref:hypothetical protein n=1 Tax=Laspinema palackyanum TaxID=3231601 RepID=UPI00348CF882|nr:hypothetical protein [Laspinema sp. D2b]
MHQPLDWVFLRGDRSWWQLAGKRSYAYLRSPRRKKPIGPHCLGLGPVAQGIQSGDRFWWQLAGKRSYPVSNRPK